MRRFAIIVTLAVVVAACGTTDGENPTTAVFGPQTTGSWQLVSGFDRGKVIPIVASHPITITIEDGQIFGTAACNSYSVEVVDGAIAGFSVTEMACGPATVMESEAAYLAALLEIEESAVEDGLALVGHHEGQEPPADETELHFVRLDPAPMADLLGTVWVLEGLITGETVSSVAGDRATLELFSDGSFIGSTGCRDVSGTYVVTGAEVQFTDFGATGECPQDLADQDSRVISALEGGFRVEVDDGRMTTWVAGDEGLIYGAES